VLRLNLSAPFFLSQAAARWWIGGGRGKSPAGARLKIINIASLLSFQGGVFGAVLHRQQARHSRHHQGAGQRNGRRSASTSTPSPPGYIETENTRPLREDPKRSQTILDRIPEGRWGKPEDIAGGCLFLASTEADYLNGTILNIDGGWLAR